MVAYNQIVPLGVPTRNPNTKPAGQNYWSGYCLAFCRLSFNAPVMWPTAIDAYGNAAYKHEDGRPGGASCLIWFAVSNIPDGHVAILLPDGRVRSTGFNSTYKEFDSYEAFVASMPRSWGTVRYLGWTEDVNGVRFIAPLEPSGGGTKPFPTNNTRLLGDTMLIMNRTKDTTLAVFDESHWQEIFYGAGASQWVIDAANALANSLPSVAYNDAGWNGRSNAAVSLKRPVYVVDNANKRLVPIDSTTGVIDIAPVAAAAEAGAKAGIATLKVPTAEQNGAAARAAIVK